MLRLSNALTRVEEHLTHTMEKCTLDNSQIGNIVVPSCYDWLITMWHLGTDSISEYDEEKFHCSWETS